MYRLAGHTISGVEMAVAALIVALLAVAPKRVWRGARLGVTAVHESGHAVVALLVGRKVTAIHLRPDTSGVTIHYGRGGRLRRAVTSAAGYPAPGLLAVAGALLVEHRRPHIWLAALLALGVINVVLWIRNFFGFVVMAAWIGGVGWLIFRGTAGVDALVSSVAVWFLVFGGLRATTEVPKAPAASDAADLGKQLHLPSGLCKLGFVLVSAAAVVAVATVLAATPR
jgi:Peptidase M50B-like